MLVSFGIATVGIVLLSLRALPAFREAHAIITRIRLPDVTSALVDVPYRAVATPDLDENRGRDVAERLKLRAVSAEAFVRGACVLMVAIWTGLAFTGCR